MPGNRLGARLRELRKVISSIFSANVNDVPCRAAGSTLTLAAGSALSFFDPGTPHKNALYEAAAESVTVVVRPIGNSRYGDRQLRTLFDAWDIIRSSDHTSADFCSVEKDAFEPKMLNRSRNLALDAYFHKCTGVNRKNPQRVFFNYTAKLGQPTLGFSDCRVYLFVVALDWMCLGHIFLLPNVNDVPWRAEGPPLALASGSPSSFLYGAQVTRVSATNLAPDAARLSFLSVVLRIGFVERDDLGWEEILELGKLMPSAAIATS
jgi:hypothetical protein